MSEQQKIYFHEDDYCQQQLFPRAATEPADAELRKIGEFADAHRAPDGFGWTDVYVREEGLTELRSLEIAKEQFGRIIAPIMPPFDAVYTGYSSHRELCEKTAAWGTSQRCALFADWNDNGIILNVWAEFFERDNASIFAASNAIGALARLHPLVYVDWAWGYTCDASDWDKFASMLRNKLDTIAEGRKSFKKG